MRVPGFTADLSITDEVRRLSAGRRQHYTANYPGGAVELAAVAEKRLEDLIALAIYHACKRYASDPSVCILL